MKRKLSFEQIHEQKLRERRKQIRARKAGKPYDTFSLAKHVDAEVLKRPLNLSRAKVPISEADELRRLYGRPPLVNWSKCLGVERRPHKMSGAWVFKATRVPVSALLENLEGGATLEEFVEHFPGVTKKHLMHVIEFLLYSLEQRDNPRR